MAFAELRSNFAPPGCGRAPQPSRGVCSYSLQVVVCLPQEPGLCGRLTLVQFQLPTSSSPSSFQASIALNVCVWRVSAVRANRAVQIPTLGPGPAPPTTSEALSPAQAPCPHPAPRLLLLLSAQSLTGTRAESISTPACPPLPPCVILSGSGTRWRPGNPRLSPTLASSFFCSEEGSGCP